MLANSRAANWHRWFAGDAEDARGRMGWRGRYTDALGNAGEVYNYYSTGDEVFHEVPNPPWLLEGMTESTANYCWQKQETLKGSGLIAGTLYGGWQFHGWLSRELVTYPGGHSEYVDKTVRYTAAEAAQMVENGSITNSPVFDRGFSPMFDRDAETNDVSLALGKYVPAVSRPMGGNAVASPRLSGNEDLNDNRYRNGWGRTSGDDDDTASWKHSDMKDMAFFYVYKLYEQLIQKGDLK